MEQVPIRVLNQETAAVLDRVEHGETIEVTNRGKPVARIVPVRRGELDDLIAAGKVIPASTHEPFAVPTVEGASDEEAGALLRRLRDEERW